MHFVGLFFLQLWKCTVQKTKYVIVFSKTTVAIMKDKFWTLKRVGSKFTLGKFAEEKYCPQNRRCSLLRIRLIRMRKISWRMSCCAPSRTTRFSEYIRFWSVCTRRTVSRAYLQQSSSPPLPIAIRPPHRTRQTPRESSRGLLSVRILMDTVQCTFEPVTEELSVHWLVSWLSYPLSNLRN